MAGKINNTLPSLGDLVCGEDIGVFSKQPTTTTPKKTKGKKSKKKKKIR